MNETSRTQASQCRASRHLFPLGAGLQMLGFALMAGGMLALGAFTAPVVFHHFPREEAAPVMALIFGRYDKVLLVALGLALLGEALRWVSCKPVFSKSRLSVLRLALLTALTLGMLASTLAINPQIQQMNQSGRHRDITTAQGRQFDATHKLSESLYKMELLLVVLLILLTPFAGGLPSVEPDVEGDPSGEVHV